MDPSTLLQVIAGESVFGMDIDSQIRQASNCMSTRLIIERFNRCDTSSEVWQSRFAEPLSEFLAGDPRALIGFDDGRWQDKEIGDEENLPPIPEPYFSYHLRLRFRNEDAAYYQFPQFPSMDQAFPAGGARKREGEFQHLKVDVVHPDDLQLFGSSVEFG